MKLSHWGNGTGIDAESRKRALQRREMGQAYRKNAQYQAPKNPLLEALENLLSGKTEKDLHTAEQEKREMDDLHVQQPFSDEGAQVSGQENTLSPIEPPSPGVQQAADGREKTGNIQEQEAAPIEEMVDENAAALAIDEKVEIPERFMGSFAERDTLYGTLLSGRQMESRGHQHLFQLASVNYLHHIAMVKNGYRSFDEPIFSKTA